MQFFIITSGSMSPTITTGSLVAVSPPQTVYETGQIIAFKSSQGTITHRITDRRYIDNQFYYLTRGDANQTVDPNWITTKAIVGTVVWHVPYIGYGISVLKIPVFFIVLVLLPATILIIQELVVMKQAWQELRKPNVQLPISLLCLIGSLSFLTLIPLAQGLLTTNTATLSHNTFQVGSTNHNPCELNVNINFENTNTGPGSVNTNQASITHVCNVNIR